MGIQVTELTRNLMPWGKEYFDFSFAGHHISEFGLVAATSSDRYTFEGSPEFESETSSVKGVNGQYYWGNQFKTKTYTYNLATDGMTERQFNDFKRLFRPGSYGQFYEDSWFDRYCYVRVKEIVKFTFIPFWEYAEVAGVRFRSRIYKGECQLTLIQDKPFQYSFYQTLDTKIADLTNKNDNGQAALRMMYHSNIPARDSWPQNVKCATGGWEYLPAKNDSSQNTLNKFGKGTRFPFYNPSTFSSEADVIFTLERKLTQVNPEDWEPVYFNEIANDITDLDYYFNTIHTTSSLPVNVNFLRYREEGRYDQTFKYGMPEVNYQVNKAIKIAWDFYQENTTGALVKLQDKLQEEIVNFKVLTWAIKVLQRIQINPALYNASLDVISSEPVILNSKGEITNNNPAGLVEQQSNLLEEAASSVYGTIYFQAGESREFEASLKEYSGCLKAGKITVNPGPICDEAIEVDWFGYFNIMMLMMFAELENEGGQFDIFGRNTFGKKFYPYTLSFKGGDGQTFMQYNHNQITSNEHVEKVEVLEENCSNIVSSDYLDLEGGDCLDVKTGKIASYHIIDFRRGQMEKIELNDLTLTYKYTYA